MGLRHLDSANQEAEESRDGDAERQPEGDSELACDRQLEGEPACHAATLLDSRQVGNCKGPSLLDTGSAPLLGAKHRADWTQFRRPLTTLSPLLDVGGHGVGSSLSVRPTRAAQLRMAARSQISPPRSAVIGAGKSGPDFS